MSIDLSDLEAEVLPIAIEGYLLKKKTKGLGKFSPLAWAKRYFVVSNLESCVTYAKSESGEALKCIPYENILSCKADKSDKKRCRFKLLTKVTDQEHRVYDLQAEAPDDTVKWIACFRKIGKEHREEGLRRAHAVMKARCSIMGVDPAGVGVPEMGRDSPMSPTPDEDRKGTRRMLEPNVGRSDSARAMELEGGGKATSSTKLCCTIL